MRDSILNKITNEADELARQYNKTKDSGLREQWFKLVRQLAKLQIQVS